MKEAGKVVELRVESYTIEVPEEWPQREKSGQPELHPKHFSISSPFQLRTPSNFSRKVSNEPILDSEEWQSLVDARLVTSCDFP